MSKKPARPKGKGGDSPAAAAHTATGSRGGPPLLWLQGLLCGALVALAGPVALLLGILLAPAGLAALLDRESSKPVARCVLLCGLGTCVGPVGRLWSSGQGLSQALALVTEPRVIGIAWGAAAGGWMLCELAPIVLRLALDVSARSRAARLRARREQLAEAWGFSSE
ncbi:MAG: hypothetical protein ACREF3_17190 [Acetobacteraceae bacterium]